MSYESCSCDYDAPSVCRTKMVKARKEYRCEECRRDIPVGEQYENTWGVWEGSPTTFRTCDLCAELRQWARISVPCFCWTYGDLHENVRDLVSEARRDCPPGWVMEWGRRMIKIERQKFGQHWPRMWQRRRPRRIAYEIATGVSNDVSNWSHDDNLDQHHEHGRPGANDYGNPAGN